MIYLWIKAFHVAAAIIWIGGMLLLALLISTLAALPEPRSPQVLRVIGVVRRWDTMVTTPAMVLVWILGLTMALQAGWFASHWLSFKLAIVGVLTGLHGVQSGTLRRLAYDAGRKPPAFLRFSAPFILAAITAIAVLVVIKPF
jgi:putative membrane protein